ncbi:MAG: ABC-2 type transport system ATP-binding protein [Haloarculaceae archaeon]|jgi:ABC-2 type transport system ATP-binding protein
MSALDISGVTKRYGGVTALQNLDLTVSEGEVFGFLGPNGAGKTTTIDVVLDYAKPTAGTVEVFGIDAQQDPVGVRQQVGVLPEGFNVLGEMTAREHVEFAVRSKDATDDVEKLLDLVGLTPAADRAASDYSKGMRQRLALAMAIAGDPDLLILDEPTTGLDPNAARFVRDTVDSLSDDGTAVFFSSHILDQVEAVADRVGILRGGSLVAVDSIDGLRQATGAQSTLRVTLDTAASDCLDSVRSIAGVSEASAEDHEVVVTCENSAKAAVVDAVRENGARVEDFETSEASLDELFAEYT